MTDPIEDALRQVAESVGATVHRYPSPRHPVRRRTLREYVRDEDTQFEEAVLDADGTVYVIGRDSGPLVSAVFGESVSTYEWVYVIPPDRVPDLRQVAGVAPDTDVLDAVARLYEWVGGRLYHPLTGPPVGAAFDTWHS